MRLKYLGHAGFELLIEGKTVVVDPFITKNESSHIKIADISKADIVAVTHSHFDHIGDAVEIARRDHACFVSTSEVRQEAVKNGVKDVFGLNIGGSAIVKGLQIVCTQAHHSGNPCGFVFGVNGIYHAGDTALFGDMALIAEMYSPLVALLPIGGYYTMGPREAAKAAELLKAKYVVPMHYNTFPQIRQDPEEFKKMVLERIGAEVLIFKEGESVDIKDGADQ